MVPVSDFEIIFVMSTEYVPDDIITAINNISLTSFFLELFNVNSILLNSKRSGLQNRLDK